MYNAHAKHTLAIRALTERVISIDASWDAVCLAAFSKIYKHIIYNVTSNDDSMLADQQDSPLDTALLNHLLGLWLFPYTRHHFSKLFNVLFKDAGYAGFSSLAWIQFNDGFMSMIPRVPSRVTSSSHWYQQTGVIVKWVWFNELITPMTRVVL